MNWTGDVLAVCLLAAGGVLGLLAEKRRLDRTNEFGVQRFASFSRKLRGRTADYVLTGSANGLAAAARSSCRPPTWKAGWVVMGPVSLFVLYLLMWN